MLEFKCVNTPIMDWEKRDGATVGRFTGTVRVESDMRRPEFIDGAAAFNTDEACERIKLRQLIVDLNADMTGVWCLYHDPAQQEKQP